MSLSSGTAQTRELTELRNHLKWLDEERRKSARKMAEIEQRLAQQGRELSERDQKIQELEWHIANFNERFERLPDNDPTAAHEQRLQDLEWHLSNINTQLVRLPNPEEERARLREELVQATAEFDQRVQAAQSQIEARVMGEVTSMRETEGRLTLQMQALQESLPSTHRIDERLEPVIIQQTELGQAISRLTEENAAQKESINLLSTQLRDRMVTLAAESQTNLATLASRFQDHLDDIAEQFETRSTLLSAELEQRLSERIDQNEMRATMLAADLEERMVEVGRGPDITPELLRLTNQVAELEKRTADIGAVLEPLGSNQADLAAMVDSLPGLAVSVTTLEQQLGDVRIATESLPNLIVQLAEYDQRLTDLSEAISPLQSAVENIQGEFAQLPALAVSVNRLQGLPDQVQGLSAVADQVAHLSANSVKVDELNALSSRVEEFSTLSSRVEELSTLSSRVEDLSILSGRVEGLSILSGRVEELSILSEKVEELSTLSDQVQHLSVLPDQLAQLEESISRMGNVREIMPLFSHLEQEMELRQAEELRLANLLSAQEGRFGPLTTAIEEMREANLTLTSRLSDSERLTEELRRGTQDFNDNWKPILTEVSRRLTPLSERLATLNNNILKAEASLQALSGDQSEMRETLVNLTDDVNRSRAETGRQLETWQTTLDEYKDTIERFTQQWLTLSNQYKEARMAVQNFAHWQKQLEQQKREASEMLRIETNRMQSRWDGFLLEIQEKLKNFELDLSQKWQVFELENEQKWAGARRSEQLWREELATVDDLIQKLQQDNRNLIWRVQAAQAEAIKKWPRLIMDEVEKAVELNPNRRLSSAAAAPRTEMSVVDAIEQGLINIEYSDENAVDL